MKSKVLIAHESTYYAESLRSLLLDRGIDHCEWCNEYNKCVDLVKNEQFDLAIIHINGTSASKGFQLASILKTMYGRTKIMLITTTKSATLMKRAESIGAEGFIESTYENFVDAVHTVLQGKTYYNVPEIANSLSVLTQRETEVAELMVNELSIPDIAKRLGVTIETVRTHRKNIYSKLGINNIVTLTKILMRAGFIE